MNGLHHGELALAREAAEWLDKLGEGGPDTNAAFAAWISASPLHIKAFLNATSVDRLLDGVDSQKRIDVDHLIGTESAVVVPLRDGGNPSIEAPPLTSAGRRHRLAAIAAAAGLLAVITWWTLLHLRTTQAIATAPGELRTVVLTDGSHVSLYAGSRLDTRFSSEAREIFLDGEATFEAKKDSSRPFRVHSGNTVIQAIGTRFNVNGRPSSTIVSVIEGIVQVSPAVEGVSKRFTMPRRLEAGEAAFITHDGRIEQRALPRVPDIGAKRTRLIFEEDRLDDIAAEFNRWNEAKIRIEGAELASRLYSGAFNSDDPQSLVAFLKREGMVDLEWQGRDLIIRAPRP